VLLRRPGLSLAVVEKEAELASHQTGHNSGVLHAGLYYAPGSRKARLCREGKATLEEFAQELTAVGEDQKCRARSDPADMREQIESASVGKTAARDDGIGAGTGEHLPGLSAIVRLRDGVAVRLQDLPQALADARVVFDEEDSLPGRRNGISFRGYQPESGRPEREASRISMG